MANQSQNLKIHGNNSIGLVAGDDIVFGDKYSGESHFFEPNLDEVKPPEFESPPSVRKLIEHLNNRRLLILGGQKLTEKGPIARHIAWFVSQKVKLSGSNLDEPIIKEWVRSSEIQRLESALEEDTTGTIFILPKVSPHHVDYDLQRLQTITKDQHFVIITTNTTWNQWYQDENSPDKVFWQELSPDELYDPDYLTAVLVRKLQAHQAALPVNLLPDGLDPEGSLVNNLSIREVAVRLQTPNKINSFILLLCRIKRAISKEVVYDLIKQLQGDRKAISQWYSQLDKREQLLALGLTFFDGLFDDQLFAALELLVASVWRSRDPLLPAFDYHDLDNLTGYFNFVETASYGTKIESYSLEQRQSLFEVAFKRHRRQILATLPIITQIIKFSGQRDVSNKAGEEETFSFNNFVSQARNNVEKAQRTATEKERSTETEQKGPINDKTLSRWQAHGPEKELYGSTIRINQLHQVISESLSYIGLLSISTVERVLLELAADSNRELQMVAASAMARWRENGRSKELFEILRSWQNEAELIDLIESLGRGRDKKEKNPLAYIRSTVALTISYAALYDPPNQLSSELCNLLVDLSKDSDPVVRDRFRGQTLPLTVAFHSQKLESDLRKMVRYTDLISPIAIGLGVAYDLRPREVINILDRWYQDSSNDRPSSITKSVTTQREALLATVALTYGYIEYDNRSGFLTAQKAFERLETILTEEEHPFVREAVFLAIRLQSDKYLAMIEPFLQQISSQVVLSEREVFISIFEEAYLSQRKQMRNGEDTLKVDGVSYQVWINSKRPLTAVEEAMYRWIQDSTKPEAQQIATQSLVAFARSKLEKEETQYIKSVKLKRKSKSSPSKPVSTSRTSRPSRTKSTLNKLSIYNRFVLYIATLNNRDYREAIRAIFAEAAKQKQFNLLYTNRVLARWRGSDDTQIQKIAKYIEKAFSLRGQILLLLLIIFILFIAIASQYLSVNNLEKLF